MEITIKGTEKEIAEFVLQLRTRQTNTIEMDLGLLSKEEVNRLLEQHTTHLLSGLKKSTDRARSAYY